LRYRQNTTVTNTTDITDLCGETRALTYTLGGTHNNPAVTWSVVSGGGVISGSTYDPGTYTGSVTIRAEVGYCSSDVTINVTTGTVDISSITVSDSDICVGETVTLTAVDGGPTTEWFTAPCGGVPFNTGPSINVSPTSTTTYYARAAVGCDGNPGTCIN